jgi:hypothetical protein
VACTRCGHQERLPAGRRCARCALTEKLALALDDGTGRVNPALAPLFAALTAMDKPRAGLIWLQNPKVVQLLGDLATGRIPLTHQGLHAVASWRTAAYLRDLLMTCGVLPTIDKQLVHYETWLHRRLADLADGDSPHLRLLRQFAGWDQLPRLRATAERRPLTPSHRQFASDQLTQAHRFLGWLQQRDHTLAQATQADLDAWHATHNDHQRRCLRAFLRWATRAGHLPRRTLPPLPVRRVAPLTQHRRLELLGQLLTDQDRPLRSRVAACLMLLFAQPATRIVRLTIDDITRAADGQVFIRFGEPPTPVPAGCSPDAEPASRCTPATSASSSGISASPPWPAGPPRCASSSSRSQHQSSPKHWATTTTPPPGSPARPVRPGAATPQATIAGGLNLSDRQGIRDSRSRGYTGIRGHGKKGVARPGPGDL